MRAVATTFARDRHRTSTTAAPMPFVPAVTTARWPDRSSTRSNLRLPPTMALDLKRTSATWTHALRRHGSSVFQIRTRSSLTAKRAPGTVSRLKALQHNDLRANRPTTKQDGPATNHRESSIRRPNSNAAIEGTLSWSITRTEPRKSFHPVLTSVIRATGATAAGKRRAGACEKGRNPCATRPSHLVASLFR